MSKTKNLDISIIRKVVTLLLIVPFNGAIGQALPATATVKNYNTAQKRLLVISTAQFINFLSQTNLDQDSVMNMASQISGMPFLLPYNANFPGNYSSEVSTMVNAGNLKEAKRALKQLAQSERIQGYIEIFLWYLHRDGAAASDLDSAAAYIAVASQLSTKPFFNNWRNECLIQIAELEAQKNNGESGSYLFEQLAIKEQTEQNFMLLGRAYMRMGDLLLPHDSVKLKWYYKSLQAYAILADKEKQIELLWKIAACHATSDYALTEKDLREILALQNQSGFRHSLFAENILSYALFSQENYLTALNVANAALENMLWSGILDVQGSFYIRLGAIYRSLGKPDEEFQWLHKAMLTGTNETHLFWYKSLLFLSETIAIENENPRRAIFLIDSVTAKFPPVTIWEKMQLLSDLGLFYQLLNQPGNADKYYSRLYGMALSNPLADPYGELNESYFSIARFYISEHKLSKARSFLSLSRLKDSKVASTQYNKYWLYYQIDSLEGNFKAALQNHIRFKYYYDSAISMSQRQKFDELTIKYAAEKKDQDIKLLKQQGIAQQSKLKQNKLTRNIMIAGTALLIIIACILVSRFKLKQRTNKAISKKNMILQQLLDEKQWLLKEVQHRVKINLHTIISLLEIQAAYLENDALKAIENSQHRIYAMSLIHQKLYQAENVKTIDMSVYLPEFLLYLDQSFEIYNRIQFILDIETIHLGVSQAIPVALIINEAVTNSIKHAFPDNLNGLIEIIMHRKANQVTLIVADSGIGIDETLLNAPSETLGLKLMKGLSGDINASFAVEINKGTKITIVFDVDSLAGNNVLSGDINYKQEYV